MRIAPPLTELATGNRKSWLKVIINSISCYSKPDFVLIFWRMIQLLSMEFKTPYNICSLWKKGNSYRFGKTWGQHFSCFGWTVPLIVLTLATKNKGWALRSQQCLYKGLSVYLHCRVYEWYHLASSVTVSVTQQWLSAQPTRWTPPRRGQGAVGLGQGNGGSCQ